MGKHPAMIFVALIILAAGAVLGYLWAMRQFDVSTSVFRTEGVEAIEFEEVFEDPTDDIGYDNPIKEVELNPFTE